MTTSARNEHFLTIDQVAARLQVSTKTIRRLIKLRDIPIERVGSRIRIRPEHVALFTEKHW